MHFPLYLLNRFPPSTKRGFFRLQPKQLYPYMVNGHGNPVRIYDEPAVNQPPNQSSKDIPYDIRGGIWNFPPASNLPKRGYYNHEASYLHPPVRYPKYSTQNTFSWSEVLPNGGYVNNSFQPDGYQDEVYHIRNFHIGAFQNSMYQNGDFRNFNY